MDFSVLISLYDKEKANYLDEAFNSIFIQTVQPQELILVFDGYINDSLVEVVDKWKKKFLFPVKIIYLKKNVGLAAALNVGLKSCIYDYVARFDTDDICVENRFELQVKFAEENPNIDIFGGVINEYDEDMQKVQSKRELPTTHKELVDYSKKRSPLNHPTVFFKKEAILLVGGYDEELKKAQDYFLWVKLIKANFYYWKYERMFS